MAKVESYSYPRPWKFVWQDYPHVIDARGEVVCSISTGTLDTIYDSKDIQRIGKAIAKGGGK